MTKNAHTVADLSCAFGNALDEACVKLGLALSSSQKHKLFAYLSGLLLWNKAYNLTAIKSPNEALVKHIFDCLAMIPTLDKLCDGRLSVRILDVGTGAGLPAVILAIVRPHWHITALDSNGKKIRFIRQMVGELKLHNIHPVASRIENFVGEFEIITSRAFASLTDFIALTQPYLDEQGVLCAMKGKSPSDDELNDLTDWQTQITPLSVPSLEEERCLVILTKHHS